MLHFIFFFILIATLPNVQAQEKSNPAEVTQETVKKIESLLGEAQSLQARHRYFDALLKLDEAERIMPQHPGIYNLRGAVYIAAPIRFSDKAKEQFEIAAKLQPNEMPPIFNIAEVDFVNLEWGKCEAALQALEKKFPKLPIGIRHLVLFKRIICLAKMKRLDEAEKIIAENFGYMDDTPAYYFSKGIIAFERENEKKFDEWLMRAQVIFKKTIDTAAYLDSLKESGYIHKMAVPVPFGG